MMKKEWAAEKQKSGRRMILGAAAAVGSCLACTFADMFIKWLPAVSSGELTFFRGVFGVLFLSLKTKERIIGGGHKTLLCLRGLLGGLGLYFFILSVQGLTLGDCQILAQMSAFFMCLLSPIFLKEKLPRKAVPGLFAIAAGTLCVLQVWNFSSFNVYSLCVFFRGGVCGHRETGGKGNDGQPGDRAVFPDVLHFSRVAAHGRRIFHAFRYGVAVDRGDELFRAGLPGAGHVGLPAHEFGRRIVSALF